MSRRLTAVACALLASCPALGAQSAPLPRENLVLCMGHSNMSGANWAHQLLPYGVPFRQSTQAWNPVVQRLEWYRGYNAQGWANSALGHFGPDVGIVSVLEWKYRSMVLVKLAAPGSPLMAINNQHKPAFERSANQLWPLIVQEVQAVEAAVRAAGKEPYWAEMVWIQWETDANRPAGYGAAFAQFVADMRSITSPDLSVTVERPLRHPSARWSEEGWQSITSQLEWAAAGDPLMRLVDVSAVGLTFNNDNTHRDTTSTILEGLWLGVAMYGTLAEVR